MLNKTLFWMIGSIFSFTLMAIAGRELSGTINTFEVLFFRSLIGLIFISLVIISLKQPHHFKTAQFKGQLLRNVFHFLGQYGWFIGLGILPLAQVFAIEFTVPFWTAIIAAVFLKEPLKRNKVLSIIIAFIGVLLVVKPPLSHLDSGSIIVLGAAICFGFAHTSTKMLSKNNHPLSILFYMCLIQLPIAGILMLPHWTQPNTLQWSLILMVALTALSAHYCMTQAMRLSSVTTVVTLDFVRLPVAAIVAFFIYQEPFGLLSIVGSILIFFAMLLNFKKQIQ